MPSFEEFTEGLADLTDVDSLWRHTANLAYSFGFSSCSLTIAGRRTTGLESTCLKSDLSEEFQSAYRFQGLVDCDPFLQFSCTSLTAKRIDSSNLSSIPGASIEHEMFLDHAATAGATSGYGIPVRPAGDEIFGGWLFTSAGRNDDFDRLISDHGRDVHLAAILAYERMAHLGLRKTSVPAGLSRRERECLLWLCAGLRVSSIADKLSISESAVNLYVSNAKRKLGTKTREQAIARAIVTGEISI